MPSSDTHDRFRWIREHPKPAIIIALVLLGLAFLILRLVFGQDNEPKAPKAVPIEVVRAERRDVPHLMQAVGTVQSLQAVTVRAQVDGILTRIHFREGELVARGQLLANIDDRAWKASLAASQAQLARDQAQLRLAELDLDRYEELLKRDAIARQTVDQQRAQVAQLRGTVALDRANVNAAQVNLSFTRIVAPVAGRVGIRQVDQGNLVRMSDPNGIVTVAQIDPISIIFPVPQNALSQLQANFRQPGARIVEALDRETGGILGEGEITAIDNQIDAASGTARVRAQFVNRQGTLNPGSFVAVQVRTGFSHNAVVLPAKVVRPGVEGQFVYRVENGVAKRARVSLGFASDTIAVITEGVAPGDLIVSDGYSRLRDGAKVAISNKAAEAGPKAAAP
ncbi:efflux RND transporter periplasmic adaptor subunit [Tsuneonella sp. CC-YZS046]|uniref:efflux RND transporter periplasmic adaptor subunit n=1 Tax=Tsuneonella sp. CC-YZS046 TaxID=3042152 RepID=UPI002D787489|nr:efflux RND transporter periplasmic adaptor subunit [Tsuneonella sp. CC-YZS046]WRO67780.1 efflux RND transporter periplasmic adaptor subunit [Tsuneonella sp. CC-YZS046]